MRGRGTPSRTARGKACRRAVAARSAARSRTTAPDRASRGSGRARSAVLLGLSAMGLHRKTHAFSASQIPPSGAVSPQCIADVDDHPRGPEPLRVQHSHPVAGIVEPAEVGHQPFGVQRPALAVARDPAAQPAPAVQPVGHASPPGRSAGDVRAHLRGRRWWSPARCGSPPRRAEPTTTSVPAGSDPPRARCSRCRPSVSARSGIPGGAAPGRCRNGCPPTTRPLGPTGPASRPAAPRCRARCIGVRSPGATASRPPMSRGRAAERSTPARQQCFQ